MTEYTPGLWWLTFTLVWSHVAAVYNADLQIKRHQRVRTLYRNKYAAKVQRSRKLGKRKGSK